MEDGNRGNGAGQAVVVSRLMYGYSDGRVRLKWWLQMRQ